MREMPNNIEGFNHIEYLIVFNAVLFGVIAAEYFSGWGAMLRYRRENKFYALHFLWTLFAFFTFMQNWYGIWPRTKFINDNILYFFYSLAPMFVYHLITVALFPGTKNKKNIDYKLYYFSNSRLLFILFALYFLLAISSSYVYEDLGNVLFQNLIRAAAAALSLVAAYFYKKVWLHYIFVMIGFLGLIDFILHIPT